MSSPVTAKQMRLSLSANGSVYTVAVVEMTNIELLREGGVEYKYGLRGTEPDDRHKVGQKHAKFTLRRWFKTDPNQGKLFYDIHNDDLLFTLREYVKDSSGFVGLSIGECASYDYREITGTANDIVGEEISGEGTVSILDEIVLSISKEYPTCSWWATGTWLPAIYSTENLMNQSWKDDDTWDYYMALIDYWTTQNEDGNALYDFGSPKDTTYHVRWKGIVTPNPITANAEIRCIIYAGLTSIPASMTKVRDLTISAVMGGPSVTFDIETVSFSGNYRYIYIYFTTFGIVGGQIFIDIFPTKLWVNGVWRDLFK
jgi:hypothetical protein